jgi:hypothetical protein
MSETQRAAAWTKDDPFGVEFAELAIGEERMSETASSFAANITSTPTPS